MFYHDAESRQISFFVATNSGSTPDATYTYDGEARRVGKVSSSENTTFVYDAAGALIEEYSGGTLQTAYVYAGSTLLSTETSSATNYMTADHLGSPRIVTDSSGNVVSRRDYTAFGEETVTSQRTTGLGYNPQTLRQDYTGYQKDGESGLEYSMARYFNSSHGRYTSVDPLPSSATIREPQSFNRYSYASNSPYNFTNPLGLQAVEYAWHCPNCSEGPGGGGAFSGALSSGESWSLDVWEAYAVGYELTGIIGPTQSAEGHANNPIRGESAQDHGSPGPRIGPTCPSGCHTAVSRSMITGADFLLGPMIITEEMAGGLLYPPNLPIDTNAPGYSPVSPTRIVRKFNYTLTLALTDITERGETPADFDYEVNFSDSSSVERFGATGRQHSEKGQAFLGSMRVGQVQFASGSEPAASQFENRTSYSNSGRVTVFGSNGRTATLDFRFTVEGTLTSISNPTIVEWMQPKK
jgi:RHS repeat-associated protein